MMTEYGIFSDEGLVEGGFYDAEEAQEALDDEYAEDDCHVAEICPEHEGQERGNCEECNADGEDEDDEPDFSADDEDSEEEDA